MAVIHNDMTMRDYLNHSGLSSSGLTYFAKSPNHYNKYRNGSMRIEGKHLDLGTAVHAALESFQKFEDEYIVRPEGIDKRTKAGKEAFAEFEQSTGAKIILDKIEYDKVLAMVKAVDESDDPLVQFLMHNPSKDECSIFWTEQGIEQKCRPDKLIQANSEAIELMLQRWPNLIDCPFDVTVCMDFKTCQCGSPESWPWTVKNFSYDLKAAHYLAGTKANLFAWLAIESCPPFNVSLYVMGSNRANRMLDQRNQLLSEMKVCMERNVWPGYRMTSVNSCID